MSRYAVLAEALRMIPQEWDLLHSVGPVGVRHPDLRSRSVGGARLPLNLTVVHLLDTTRPSDWWGLDPRSVQVSDLAPLAMLESWSRVIHEDAMELGLDHPELTDPPNIATECAWLLAMLDYACAQQWATEMARDIATLRRSIRTALGGRVPAAKTCPACTSPKSAIVALADTRLVCLECEASWSSGQSILADIPNTDPDPLMRIPDVADILDVSHWTIRSWIGRGRLQASRDASGQQVVRLWEARRIAEMAAIRAKLAPGSTITGTIASPPTPAIVRASESPSGPAGQVGTLALKT